MARGREARMMVRSKFLIDFPSWCILKEGVNEELVARLERMIKRFRS